ncbi:ran-binding proteins 9/10 homolog isoform X2 [Bactrocera neohumeralis]|uniref:ran-binding proteins 9/10 homolog isoform X2 n=1 Tax=Bactrocera tryoni TaxID=59916 RepID=UPI001A962D21|nr:ran-binding proteins 9/10 homolog isoform X2 [Bactrocera tryoni]XP_050324746.1 ran-binding proteins 9/10 homolog isoform X2 [Bactrocera neohumeralis]
MDTDNDNEQLNSSSTSSSNNSSSSNLLANLPMLPILQSTDNDGGGHFVEPEALPEPLDERIGAVGLPQPPSPSPPPPPTPPQQQLHTAGHLPDNSVFASPLLFNNNTTPPPSSSSSSSSPTSSSHNLQLYHHQQEPQQLQQEQLHSEHALHFEHSPSPSLQQHALLPPPPSPPPPLEQEQQQQQQQQHLIPEAAATAQHQQALEQQDIQEELQLTHPCAFVDNSPIADTIDASALESAASEAIGLSADIASTSQQQQQTQPQRQCLQQQEQPVESLSGAQRSTLSVIGEGAAGSSASNIRNQTPPISLPLLLQEEDDEDEDADADDEENLSGEQQRVRAPKSPAALSYASHFTHHPFTHPLNHHHHHHYYPNFGGCINNSPFAFDIPALSGGGDSISISSNNNNNSGISFVSQINPSNGANTNAILTASMLGSSSNSDNPSGGGGGATALSSTITCAGAGAHSSSNHNHHSRQQVTDRLKMLYPNVNEAETPLPRCWSPHDKCLSIGLSQNNLHVHYKGVGNKHDGPASVRTAHPIPPACGLYYFEVKIISKGKDGYMGIGLTAQQFRMNRLPGWDKHTYGYHGDDGNSYAQSNTGQSYGPTFTTGDVIGCCVNFVDNSCFYTKNGIDLGVAFRDLPVHKCKLYPTVGLQTPGEEIDANFGQEPFKFDQIEDMMKQMRAQMRTAIYDFPMTLDQGDPTTLLHKMVSSYLLHNGYSQTAEAFARTTGQTFQEDISSIRNRQKILKLVLSGKMGHAIEHTLRSYPGLLENNKSLWFMLKCRQFIEMVNGSDIEYCPTTNNKLTNSITTQTQTTPPNQTSVIQSTKSYQNGKSTVAHNNAQTMVTTSTTTTNSAVINADNHAHQQELKNTSVSDENCSGDAISISNKNNSTNIDYLNDVEMELNMHTNGNSCKNGSSNFNSSLDVDEEMDIDVSPSAQKYSHGIERILEFGKELSQMGQQLEKENKLNDEDRQMLEDAFSLIAYSNPWSSPLGWQLCPTKRENVCTALNSAILESMNYPRRPPLDVCVAHAAELLKVMARESLGACAFVNIEDVFPQN